MNIALDLNPEQQSALDAVVADNNLSNKESLTPEQFLQRSLQAQIDACTKAAFDATVRRLAEAVAPLPFDARQAIIAQIESNLQ